MAGTLHVRNLDDDLVARLKRRAARHGRSTEAEHREIFGQALATGDRTGIRGAGSGFAQADRRRKQTPSELLLREAGDER
jgi:plasmid stability protein